MTPTKHGNVLDQADLIMIEHTLTRVLNYKGA